MATNPLTPRVNNIETGGTWKIGDVKQSFLTEAEFQAEHDDTWVLCDGRDVKGSDYAVLKEGDAVTSHNIPDARGQFLRGLDTSGVIDPDGAGRVLGGSQGDAFGSHNHGGGNHAHSYQQGAGSNATSGGAQTDATAKNRAFPTVTTGSSGNIISTQGGAETRPKNVTCNMFIKINREPSS